MPAEILLRLSAVAAAVVVLAAPYGPQIKAAAVRGLELARGNGGLLTRVTAAGLILKQAVETAMGTALGTDGVPVTPEVRARYAELARAIACAGRNGG
jgi:hypothetical protein